MTTKPTTLPEWATDPGAVLVTPSAGKQAAGYAEGEMPPVGEQNWLHRYTYEWLAWLDSSLIEWKSAHTTQALTESTYTPLVAALDPSNGSRRSTIDHNGFRMGQVSEDYELWRETVAPAHWTEATATGGTVGYSDPVDANRPWRHVVFGSPGGAISSASLTGEAFCYVNDDRTLVIETEVGTRTAVSGTTEFEYTFYVEFFNSAAWDYFVGFRFAPNTNANILCSRDGSGAAVHTDSGVAIATTTTYRLKLEICGANNHAGSDKLVRWFINGTLVHSATVTDIPNDKVRQKMLMAGTTDATAYSMVQGPIRWGFNHRATPDNV